MTEPRVYNARKGAPPDAVYVGRGSKWGNPFAGNRQWAISMFVHHLRAHPKLVAEARSELAGRSLVCWCAPAPCHADVLLRVARGEEP